MDKMDVKKRINSVLIDIAGGLLIGVGIYNFAVNAHFPLAGISGIALIFYHLFKLPIGLVTVLLNVPIAIFCYKTLGRKFFLRSVQSVIITSLMIDYVAPLLPLYAGDRMLAAICTGFLSGLGYAIIFMDNSSTGGMDFITMAIKFKKPHISLGRIVFISDVIVVLAGGFIYKDVDGIIYGLILSYILTIVIDKMMYGIDAGKVTLIVTEKGQEVSRLIDEESGRGSTLIQAKGSFSGNDKQVVMCACNNKQMFVIRRLVKKIDPAAFTVIMESNEVVGEGFKEE